MRCDLPQCVEIDTFDYTLMGMEYKLHAEDDWKDRFECNKVDGKEVWKERGVVWSLVWSCSSCYVYEFILLFCHKIFNIQMNIKTYFWIYQLVNEGVKWLKPIVFKYLLFAWSAWDIKPQDETAASFNRQSL